MSQPEFTAAAFNRFLKEGKLMATRCRGCGRLSLPPRPMCPHCHRPDMEWTELRGSGRLAAFTCIAVGTTAMCQEGFDRNNPYCSAVVELDEGIRISGRLVGVEAGRPETIKVGSRVQAEFLQRGEEKEAVLAFRPRG
ncbi:MAG: Zn-ribbon domain-containing OB-fold protein [Chloroflexota bacterium]